MNNIKHHVQTTVTAYLDLVVQLPKAYKINYNRSWECITLQKKSKRQDYFTGFKQKVKNKVLYVGFHIARVQFFGCSNYNNEVLCINQNILVQTYYWGTPLTSIYY
jgi:hypothetical protein